MTTENKNLKRVKQQLQAEIPIQYQTFTDWYESLPANRQKHFRELILNKCKEGKGISKATFYFWLKMEHSPKQEDRNIINQIAGRILSYPDKSIGKVKIQ